MTQASTSASVDHVSTLITLPDINWVWSDTDKEEWNVVTDKYQLFYKYQQFYDHWRDRSSGSNFLDQFPYKLSLGVDELGASLLPFGAGSTWDNRILVTRSYDDMYHRLLLLRQNDEGDAKGAVLTGQPGIGASLRSLSCATTYPAHLSRKDYLPKVHARAADLSSSGRTPVRLLSCLPFLPRPRVFSVDGVRLRGPS